MVRNLIAILLTVMGYFLSEPFRGPILNIGLFAFSGALTNWLAIHMLFEKVPGFCGSLGTNFHLGPLEVFPSELRALRGEEEIQLSLRDLKILQLFHDRPSQVITRDELYNHAWGMDYFPNSRSLDQHIAQLRKKVEPNPADPDIIKTVHGAGYRYEA